MNLTIDIKFLYDGWSLIAELAADNSVLRTYMWGLDLSGSMQGAGGVGGLLELVYHATQTTNCFAAFDGNGNVAALVNAADGTISALYEYGPFAEPLRSSGPLAKRNPLRFSTKYEDDESDLVYYGYRYYSSTAGKFLSRDRLSENGGEDLYTIAFNQPITSIDPFGLCGTSLCGNGTSSMSAAPKGTHTINSAQEAHDYCQSQINQRQKNRDNPPPAPKTCSNKCDDLLDSVQSDQRVIDVLKKFGSKCKPPKMVCVFCTGAPSARFIPDPANRIEVCHNEDNLNAIALRGLMSDNVVHELTHALQYCYQGLTKGCKDSLKREMEAYYCSSSGYSGPELMEAALDSSCGNYCSAEEAQDSYQDVMQWFNTQKGNLCRFPKKPDYPE